MVGIGGGISPKVRLGDVVVGTPSGQWPGLVQWDFGKTESEGFKRIGALNNPPSTAADCAVEIRGSPSGGRVEDSASSRCRGEEGKEDGFEIHSARSSSRPSRCAAPNSALNGLRDHIGVYFDLPRISAWSVGLHSATC
jgi:hypothetical protein